MAARLPYVSRGGAKLAAALDAFNLDVSAMRALDAGASTGGFTDCLLQRGAREVVAVDVSYGQLAWSLRNDQRVRVVERTNVRALDAATLGEPVDLVVADLSFIGLRTVRDALIGAVRAGGHLVLLVKPQFELPRERVPRGSGGVVRDRADWADALVLAAAAYRERGCGLAGACASPLPGPKGNREFFLHLVRGGADAGDAPIDGAVRTAP
jgi:23S rRNA (cytidine1920-2'-O)/16S rRNA (cytidine1409-2'-O)-methyltransferase